MFVDFFSIINGAWRSVNGTIRNVDGIVKNVDGALRSIGDAFNNASMKLLGACAYIIGHRHLVIHRF